MPASAIEVSYSRSAAARAHGAGRPARGVARAAAAGRTRPTPPRTAGRPSRQRGPRGRRGSRPAECFTSAARLRALGLGDRDGAVECGYRCRGTPSAGRTGRISATVRRGQRSRRGMHGLTPPGSGTAGAAARRPAAASAWPRDEPPVQPAGPVGEEHQVAARVVRGRAAGLGQQHERQQAQRLRLVRHQVGQQAAKPDGLTVRSVRARSWPEVARVALVKIR